ncbi:MAG: prolyl oligopeptidase family serine peptidase [Bacteroidota bacterium]
METIKNREGKYLLILPAKYKEIYKNWPLLLFLHGAGERGNDLEMLKNHGPPKLVEQGNDFPFLILTPQCSIGQCWTNQYLDKLLTDIVQQYYIDKDRIYVTGFSMGGFGTWNLAIKYPNRFAAIAPVCGGGNPVMVKFIKNIPCWVFHGAKDRIVPIERSQEMVDAYEKLGIKVKFTVYPELEHDSWTETYDNPKLYDWFLAQKK